MRETTTDSIMMRPTEVELSAQRVREYIRQVESAGKDQLGYKPIPVILYTDGTYLMGEGHHTSGGLFLLQREIRICILECDRDVGQVNFGYFGDFSDMESLKHDLLLRRREALSRRVAYLEDMPVRFNQNDIPCLGDEGLLDRIMKIELSHKSLNQQQTRSLNRGNE